MKKDVLLYLDDMLSAIALTRQYMSGMTEVEFSRDTEKQDSVIHRLMIIGEAAGHLSNEIRTLSPETQWRAIVAFRNVAIHEYSGVSLGRVWEIVEQELPILKTQLTALREVVVQRERGVT